MDELENNGGAAEAIREVERLTQAAIPKVSFPGNDAPEVVTFHDPEARQVRRYVRPPRELGVVMETLASLVEWTGKALKDPRPEVYLSESGLTGMRMESLHAGGAEPEYAGIVRRMASFPLLLTDEFKAFSQAGSFMNARKFWTMLRTSFANAVSEETIKLFTRVRAKSNADGAITLAVGKGGMSREVIAEVTGTAAIPEEIIFRVQVFDIREQETVRVPVRCALDVDEESAQFRLIPIAGELQRARWSAMSFIRENVAGICDEYGVDLYEGSIHVC